MPEVIFPGPEGRIEGRFAPAPRPRAPVAMILHPHPNAGGTMNNRIVQELYKTFQRRGFATLRFNFRGVGKSQGVFDNGVGELSDAAAALVAVNELLAAHLGTAPLTPGELSRLGAGLGADVPFMLLGGAALGRGTGTELEPVPTSAQLHLVFVPQDQGLSTPAVYRRWDDSHGLSGTGAPDPVPAQALAALDPADPETLAPLVRNDLQPPAVS